MKQILNFDKKSQLKQNRTMKIKELVFFQFILNDYNQNIMIINKMTIEILSQIELLVNLKLIFQSFKSQIQINILQSINYTPGQIKRKYHLLIQKYEKYEDSTKRLNWIENEKKIFITLLLAFCYFNTKKISQITDNQWIIFSEAFKNKSVLILKYQALSIQKKQVRVIWNNKELQLLYQYIQSHSDIDWTQASHFIYFQTLGKYFKTPKQCKQHWSNHLDQKILKGNWSKVEDLIILQTVIQKGKKWAQMVRLLQNRRTEHMIKNRFNSLITRAKKQIKVNTQNMSQNELIVFIKQKISSNQQSSRQFSRKIRKIQKLKQEDKINHFSYNKLQKYQFYHSSNQKQYIAKQRLQENPIKIQFCESFHGKQNFINFGNSQVSEIEEKQKIQHKDKMENIHICQETINKNVSSNLNLIQPINSFGFYPSPIYFNQAYNYYYPTLLYPLT